MFGIENKKYVKRPDSKLIFGSTFFKLENIRVRYWVMSKICKGGARTCIHILGDICCGLWGTGGIYSFLFSNNNIHLSWFIYRIDWYATGTVQLNTINYYVWERDIVNCLLILQISYSTCNFAIPSTSIAEWERGVHIQWSIWV